MRARILALTLDELSGWHPAITRFILSADGAGAKPGRTLDSWLAGLADERLSHIGMDRAQVLAHIEALAGQVEALRAASEQPVRSLTLLGGHDKAGRPESLNLTLKAGCVLCLVGPTGSGKSRLLADIECLAQGDTPSGRRILINDAPPDPGWRFAANRKLIAQLSQNMNFVVDLSVGAFVTLHADCRMVPGRDEVVRDVIACANDLAGERFDAGVSLTQLSGGQTRALMIADTALLSASPVVLIDEIENAGIDRKKSLDLLIARDKIVLISTHDPVLALMGNRRLVIRNGAVADIIETSAAEKANLATLERIDRHLMAVRHRLRCGQRIDAPLVWPPDPDQGLALDPPKAGGPWNP
jgi:ABC-type lipoprotein export system ATPase subunit